MGTLAKFEQLRDKARELIARGAHKEPAGKLRRWAEIISECETAVTQLRNLAERCDRLAEELEDRTNPSPAREGGLALEHDATGEQRPAAEMKVVGGTMGITNSMPGRDQRSKAEQKEIVREVREEWVRRLSLKGIPLRKVEGRRVFKTQSGKIVGIACANEDSRPGIWWLGLPGRNKQFDMIVLLCRSTSGELFDFVLPAEVVSQIWPYLSRDYNGERKLHVSQVGPNFKVVDVPIANLKLINPYLSRHDFLR